MKALSPVARMLRRFATVGGMVAALPLAAQVSHTYTAPPPPGYPAGGAPRQPVSTKASRQSAAAVQTPSTYPAYPNSYPPPAGYTYPPPPPGYGPAPKSTSSRTKPAPPSKSTKTASSKKSSATPSPAPAKTKVYGPTGDLTHQVSKISDSDKIQNMRLGELERDVSSMKRGGSKGSSSPRYDGGTDIAPYTSYVVRPGDTLFRIASTHRVSVGEIQQLNRMRADEVHVGQTLLIPSPHRSNTSTTQASYRPMTPGGGPTSHAPAPASAPGKSSTASYTVKKGDSLKAIALKHGITTVALANANRIKDANKIFVGQRLTIPGKTAATGSATASRTVSRSLQPQTHGSSDTTPLAGHAVAEADDADESSPGAGQGLTPAPAPPRMEPAAPAPAKPAPSMLDTHRGILAYRVDRSDTIESIAHQFSTTPERIREMNRLDSSTPLKAGNEIMVPAMGAVSVGR